MQIAGGSILAVPGDRQQLVRLLELLIDRAVRRAHASTVTFSVERDGGGVRVRVVDDGKFVTHDEAAAMFDGRRDVPIDDPSAVGVIVCRRIVERHGGTIWADAGEDDLGASVMFTLPDTVSA